MLATASLVAGFIFMPVHSLGSTERSPFERASAAPVAAPAQKPVPNKLDNVEFTGLLSFGGEVTISLFDTKENRSFWVPLDGSQEGFSVSGFDEDAGTISVSFNGVTREIPINENEIVAMKQPVPQSRAEPPAPKPAKPVRVKDPETARQEEEARMFVSNLLAQGMQQREKYRREQEASRAAAGRN